MKNKILFFSIYLFIFGSVGIITLLLVPFNIKTIPEEVRTIVLSNISEFQLRILSLANPFILLLTSVLIGFFVNKKNYHFSYFYSYFLKQKNHRKLTDYILIGIMWGLFGAVCVKLAHNFIQFHPQIILLENNSPDFHPITAILYGGITEEIIVRWGWLSLLLYIVKKITNNEKAQKVLAISFTSILFGVSHLPLVYHIFGNSISLYIIIYVVAFNFFLSIIFGYLFTKYNLETAITAHGFFHIFALIINFFFK